MMGVYEISNLVDGKATSYVGSSADIKRRWRDHVLMLRGDRHSNSHLQAAWNKYGEGAFSFCILEQVTDEKDLLAREQHFLDRAFEVGGTYNIAQDATAPMRGHIFSEEHRRKMSEAQVGNQHWLGRRHTEETKRRIGRALIGRTLSDEHKHKVGEAMKGHKTSGETRLKISRAIRAKWLRGEYGPRKVARTNAKSYPTFVNWETGETIPAGINLRKLCRTHELTQSLMWRVVHGQQNHHKGWTLASNVEE